MLDGIGRRVRQRAEAALDRGAGKSTGLRILRDVLGGLDELVGQPFAAPRGATAGGEAAAGAAGGDAAAPVREAAPVVVYFDGKDHRTLKRIDGVLVGAAIPYRTLDVTDDEAARSWALSRSGRHELPVVFVAGEPIGGFDELLQASVDGQLQKQVFG